MNIGNYRNKVMSDDMYKLFGDLENGKIKYSLSDALNNISENYTVLDFSYNFLTNLKPFI